MTVVDIMMSLSKPVTLLSIKGLVVVLGIIGGSKEGGFEEEEESSSDDC
jgi:hypothetical protein